MNQGASDTSPHQPTLQVVSFMVGGYRFAVEAARVRAQRPVTEADAAMPVEKLLGLAQDGMQDLASRRILVIKHPTADYPILVSEPVTLCDLSLDTLHPLPDMLEARCTLNGIRALSSESEGITVLFDLGALNPDAIGGAAGTMPRSPADTTGFAPQAADNAQGAA